MLIFQWLAAVMCSCWKSVFYVSNWDWSETDQGHFIWTGITLKQPQPILNGHMNPTHCFHRKLKTEASKPKICSHQNSPVKVLFLMMLLVILPRLFTFREVNPNVTSIKSLIFEPTYVSWAQMHHFLSVCLGLWDLHCALPQRYRTTSRTTNLHCAPWCTRGI